MSPNERYQRNRADKALRDAEYHRKRAQLSERENIELRRQNKMYRSLIHELVQLVAVPSFDCCGCDHERHHDCLDGCLLVRRAREMGIVTEGEGWE